jgi:5-formyltetrahydrofolate cyclo-ligase
MTQNQHLRQHMRDRRRALGAAERSRREAELCRRMLGLLRGRGRQLGAYLAFDGEPDISPALRLAVRRGCTVALPRVLDRRKRRMAFVPWRPGGRLASNSYRIDEPVDNDIIAAHRLAVVFTPLVAFDTHGSRLGMGAGYFDRHFTFLRHRRHWFRPRLVGVAFDFQQVESLQRQPWDIPLWAVITERGLYRFSSQ